MQQLQSFLLSSLVGVILTSIVSSIFATIIYSVSQKVYRKQCFKTKSKYYLMNYAYGALAEHSKTSTYKQDLLVGESIINMIKEGLWILSIFMVTAILIYFVEDKLMEGAIIVACSGIVTWRILRLRYVLKIFDQHFEYIFGDGFLDGIFNRGVDSLREKVQTTK